jgi:hypothetical protein
VWYASFPLGPACHQISYQFIEELSFLILVQDNASFLQEIVETIMGKGAHLRPIREIDLGIGLSRLGHYFVS